VKGQEVSLPLRLKLKTFHDTDALKTTIKVSIPKHSKAAGALAASAKA
jgi:hypothetical protein